MIAGFGHWTVSGFFVISAFVISRSWITARRHSSFILKQVLRIRSAFWAALLAGGFWCFLKNSILLMLQHPVGNVLAGSTYPDPFNCSL